MTAPSHTSRPVVLIPTPLHDSALNACISSFECIELWVAENRHELLDSRGNDVLAVATAGGTRIDAEFLDRLPHLEIVASFGAGYDNIDVMAARQRNIVVTNTPDVLNDDVADLAIALLIMTARRLNQAEAHLRAGRWPSQPFPISPGRVNGRTMGIVGLGRIGESVAARASALGVTVCYHNRAPKNSPYQYFSSITEMAANIDTLLVAVPGGAATHHMIDLDVLTALGADGILINIGRGTTVDERALIQALKDNTIYAAGLDVYEDEPRVPDELMRLPNAVLLPHVGSATQHTRQAMAQLVVDNLVHWFTEGRALTPLSIDMPGRLSHG